MCTSESAPRCMMYDRAGVVGRETFRGWCAGTAGMGYTERGDNNMNHCQCQISLGGGDHRSEVRACMHVCASLTSRQPSAITPPLYTHIYTFIRETHTHTHPHCTLLCRIPSLPSPSPSIPPTDKTTATTVRVHAYIIMCVPGPGLLC